MKPAEPRIAHCQHLQDGLEFQVATSSSQWEVRALGSTLCTTTQAAEALGNDIDGIPPWMGLLCQKGRAASMGSALSKVLIDFEADSKASQEQTVRADPVELTTCLRLSAGQQQAICAVLQEFNAWSERPGRQALLPGTKCAADHLCCFGGLVDPQASPGDFALLALLSRWGQLGCSTI